MFGLMQLSSKQISAEISKQCLLTVLKVKTKAGTRAFSVTASTLWKELPDNSNSLENIIFRHHLKIYLFNLAYPP